MLHIITSGTTSPRSWQAELSDLVTDPTELCRLLDLDPVQLAIPAAALQAFPLRVPRPYLARMEKGNPRDPLLLQVLPQTAELLEVPGYEDDPLQEAAHNPRPGLLHKYRGRVLLLPTSSCAIHCRYCFRRNFPYADNIPGRAQWQESLDWLRQDNSLTEVILSGGDPLTLGVRQLDWLLTELEGISHLQRLRFHTRVPVMIPARIDDALCARLLRSRFQSVMVIHTNHARELDDEVAAAMGRLQGIGMTLLNQSVLLRGINDSAGALRALSEALHAMHVLPYYLHLPDRTRGTAHFDIPLDEAIALHRTLQAELPGYLVPRLVREEPGKAGKTLLSD